jgi:biotin synthase
MSVSSVKQESMHKSIYLCAISNVLSGSCKEDCHFCTQSSRYKTNIQRYSFKPFKDVIEEAKRAKNSKAVGFCLVTSGLGLDKKRKEYMLDLLRKLRKEDFGLNYIGCNGLATLEDLKELKDAGLKSYNHNLETSKNYYKNICSTHNWIDRYKTALAVKEAKLKLCCGGIFGMGESQRDRDDFINSLVSLEPESVAINFYIPNPALPLKKNTLSKDEARKVIENVVKHLPKSRVMVAGGREYFFKDSLKELFELGVNSIVIGDYLTTKGEKEDKDIQAINELGYKIAKSCDGT